MKTNTLFSLLLALLVATIITLPPVKTAFARDIIGLSGSFYRQIIETPQGSTVQGPSIYVTIFNQGDRDVQIKMSSDVPFGVAMQFSLNEFNLKPGDQQRIDLIVKVSQNAVPGDYSIKVIAEAFAAAEGSGVRMVHSVAQEAKLKVSGVSSAVNIRSISPELTKIGAVARLYKIVEGQSYEVAYDEEGNVAANVAPGEFVAVAYVAGEKLAEEKFTIAGNESKTVDLVLKTAYFESLDTVPTFQESAENISNLNLLYSLKNLYKPFNDVNLILSVSHDGAPVGQVVLLQTSRLEVGRLSLSYNYTPPGGWKPGVYQFKIIMVAEGKEVAYTIAQKVEIPAPPSSEIPLTMVIIIAVVVIIIAVLILVLIRRKKKPATP